MHTSGTSTTCFFPYVDWPACESTAASRLGAAYWIVVALMALLNTIALVPTLPLLFRLWRRKEGATSTSSAATLDRPGAMRVRLAFALFSNILITPDPMGLAGILHLDFVEMVAAISSTALLSIT